MKRKCILSLEFTTKEVRMETIMKIPFLLALMASLITGFISIASNSNTNQTCLRMIIAMVSFYLVGLLVSFTLKSIVEEQNKQKLEAEAKAKEEEMLEKANAEKLEQEGHLGNSVDLFADNDNDNGFTPLDLSQAVRTKIKE